MTAMADTANFASTVAELRHALDKLPALRTTIMRTVAPEAVLVSDDVVRGFCDWRQWSQWRQTR
jgi:hypothetical protein